MVEDYVAPLDDAGNLPDGSDLVAVLYFDEEPAELDASTPIDATVRLIVAPRPVARHDASTMDAADAAPPEAPAAPIAHESAPDVPAVAQLQNALPVTRSDGAAIAMAVVAVAGGGAAFKLYSQIAKQRHEERNNHAPCAARIAELEAKLAKVESANLSIGGVDVDELIDRIEKLEKAAKAKRKVVRRA